MIRIKCPECQAPMEFDGEAEAVCPHCGAKNPHISSLLENNILERLASAAGFRRVGNFEDAQRELDAILEEHPDCAEAIFASALNDYEVTTFAFDREYVRSCVCLSTSRRPVQKHRLVNAAIERARGMQQRQFNALFAEIEKARTTNIRIRDNIPYYRAIFLYDYSNNTTDATAARGLFERLRNKTDIFFPPVTLENIAMSERGKYLVQALKNPEIAPLLFVIYSDAFNFRNKSSGYYTDIARQCEDFARVHAKTELISVTTDYEPPYMLKRLSMKTITCDNFDDGTLDELSDVIYEYILDLAYTYEEQKQVQKSSARVLLNDVPSPKIIKN